MNIDRNSRFELAASFVNQTRKPLFLTGRAGTGKTTFLKHIVANTPKEYVVVAPTGVAAINAGGVTMHSFFQLPFGPYLPGGSIAAQSHIAVNNQHTLMRNIRFNKEKRALLKSLELLIIDEVSMVRADMLDAMDAIMRRFGKKPQLPFGGVQVLFIGDLFQLPPVVPEAEWQVLREHYRSPFFFDAQVFAQNKPLCVELNKIYRQSDQAFISLLNKVRNNQLGEEDIALLNKQYDPLFQADENDSYITLSTHNAKANAINDKALNRLPGKLYEFSATVEGQFNENAYPAEEVLRLKEGAQIMFIRNDKGEDRRYYNGKIGIISRIDKEGIFVRFPEEHTELKVERDEWENIRYSFDETEQKITEDKLGKFSQYPIRLAWAITIHKSQGLTFERAIIDAGDSFSAGQVYVALSRLTSMQGLVLHSRIHRTSVSSDQRVVDFMKEQADEHRLREELGLQQKQYMAEMLQDSFTFVALIELLRQHQASLAERQLAKPKRAEKVSMEALETLSNLHRIAHNFGLKIAQYLAEGGASYATLHKRVGDARKYFCEQINRELIEPLQAHIASAKTWKRSKTYIKDLNEILIACTDRYLQIERAVILSEGLSSGEQTDQIFAKLEAGRHAAHEKFREVTKTSGADKGKQVGETYLITLELFKEGKTPEEIAEERSMAVGTIESHLARFIENGELKLQELMPHEKTEAIRTVIEMVKSSKLTDIMAKLGDEFTYGEIKWVLAERKQKKKEQPAKPD